MRIAVLKLRCLEQTAVFLKIIKDKRICVLNEDAFPICISRQIALGINELNKIHIVIAAYAGVILTKCRCCMNDTSTIGGSYIVIAHYEEALLAEILGKWIKRLILATF